jgi:hypothetical protein
MPAYDFVLNFLLENFENVKIRGNQITARCALCGDSAKSNRKARFNLKYDNKSTVYHCWNCADSGSFYKLYAIIKKIDVNDAYRECEPGIGESFISILDSFKAKNALICRDKSEYHTFNEITKDCLTEYNFEPGIINESSVEVLKKFRKDRAISSNIPLFFAYKGRFKGRIIIPVFNIAGDIIYFQARRTVDSMQPKYLNPTFPKEVIIPNFDFFELGKPVVVVEGLLDCYSIGKQSTACLGKEIDYEFIKRIRTKTKDIIIALDNDSDGIKSTNQIREGKFGREVRYFITPYKNIKDINELLTSIGPENINMYEFILTNSYDYFNQKAGL